MSPFPLPLPHPRHVKIVQFIAYVTLSVVNSNCKHMPLPHTYRHPHTENSSWVYTTCSVLFPLHLLRSFAVTINSLSVRSFPPPIRPFRPRPIFVHSFPPFFITVELIIYPSFRFKYESPQRYQYQTNITHVSIFICHFTPSLSPFTPPETFPVSYNYLLPTLWFLKLSKYNYRMILWCGIILKKQKRPLTCLSSLF